MPNLRSHPLSREENPSPNTRRKPFQKTLPPAPREDHRTPVPTHHSAPHRREAHTVVNPPALNSDSPALTRSGLTLFLSLLNCFSFPLSGFYLFPSFNLIAIFNFFLRGLKYHYVAVTASSKSDPDDNYPQYPSLPHDIPKRALNFQVAHIVLQNNVIEKNVGPHEKLPWAQSVIRKGFTALEKLLKDHAGRYATGDEIFLVVEELMKRCEETKWFIEGDFDTYLKRIQQPYVWGGEPVLLMASHAKSFLDGDEDQHEKDVFEKNLKALQNIF
ncbi:hypothetical protein Ahy_B06g079978 [Arachis hypogaea]|uniref:OTU domain-containing protein n=1 Tax=Arachis hypogaea TaxID=3818 RepID=A0A444YGS3_ARAHY|nr:hypothetical protein Ahy_B06g079978 [Arachis hypogaea]